MKLKLKAQYYHMPGINQVAIIVGDTVCWMHIWVKDTPIIRSALSPTEVIKSPFSTKITRKQAITFCKKYNPDWHPHHLAEVLKSSAPLFSRRKIEQIMGLSYAKN